MALWADEVVLDGFVKKLRRKTLKNPDFPPRNGSLFTTIYALVAVICIANVARLFWQFQQNETTYATKVEISTEYPDVTVCNINPVNPGKLAMMETGRNMMAVVEHIMKKFGPIRDVSAQQKEAEAERIVGIGVATGSGQCPHNKPSTAKFTYNSQLDECVQENRHSYERGQYSDMILICTEEAAGYAPSTVVIKNHTENRIFAAFADRMGGEMYLGIEKRSSDSWTWADGSTPEGHDFENWERNNQSFNGSFYTPSKSGDCAKINSNGFWVPVNCDEQLPYLCRAEARKYIGSFNQKIS